jgi:hypothetical protein
MNTYSYDGPVMEFGRVITTRWAATTYAVSLSKARSNLTFRFKKEHNKIPSTKITLPGTIVEVKAKGVNENGRKYVQA